MTQQKKRIRLLFILLFLLIAGLYVSLVKGSVKTSFIDFWNFLAHSDQTHAQIFIHLRFSRTLLAFLVGASLSLSGAILQGYFQNPMAGPFVVGVSSGASFGAVLTLMLGLNMSFWGFSMQNVLAFVSGFAIVSFVYILSQRRGVFKVETLLLTGIAAGALASSLTSFLIFFKSENFEQAVFWLLGSFHLADWNHFRVIFPTFILCLAISQWLAKDMNLLVMGDEIAQSLGCSIQQTRKIFLVVSTLLASSSVSVSGIIGFVGLIVPHWTRLLIGPDHRHLFFFSSIMGGVFLMFCDLLARTLLPGSELPIGIITAAVGAPFFIYLLNQRRRS
jgi:iron complex transport system permease protein